MRFNSFNLDNYSNIKRTNRLKNKNNIPDRREKGNILINLKWRTLNVFFLFVIINKRYFF